jgi:nitrogen fixation protein NifU and related proteins
MDLDALYAEVILDHNRSPRNWGELPETSRRIDGHNPLCGDRLTLYVDLDGERIRDVRFTGEGCAISTASASMMTQAVKGKTRDEAEALGERFRALVRGEGSDAGLGSLRAFAGVARFPMRVKCASLAWHALKSALAGEVAATTEE